MWWQCRLLAGSLPPSTIMGGEDTGIRHKAQYSPTIHAANDDPVQKYRSLWYIHEPQQILTAVAPSRCNKYGPSCHLPRPISFRRELQSCRREGPHLHTPAKLHCNAAATRPGHATIAVPSPGLQNNGGLGSPATRPGSPVNVQERRMNKRGRRCCLVADAGGHGRTRC